MESLRRWCQPVALVIIVALAVRVLLGVFTLTMVAMSGAPAALGLAAQSVGAGVVDVLAVVLVTALSAWCVHLRTSRARLVTVLALAVCGLTLLVALGFGVVGLPGGVVDRFLALGTRLTGLVVPAIAVAVLIKLLTVLHNESRVPRAALPETEPAAIAPPPTPYVAPAGWQPDEAAGAAWHSAGAAASGAAATGWGQADQAVGWDPVPWPGASGPRQLEADGRPRPAPPSGQDGGSVQPG